VKAGEKTPFFYKRAETEVCGQCHLQRAQSCAHRICRCEKAS
jgi:hypothetical protein